MILAWNWGINHAAEFAVCVAGGSADLVIVAVRIKRFYNHFNAFRVFRLLLLHEHVFHPRRHVLVGYGRSALECEVDFVIGVAPAGGSIISDRALYQYAVSVRYHVVLNID